MYGLNRVGYVKRNKETGEWEPIRDWYVNWIAFDNLRPVRFEVRPYSFYFKIVGIAEDGSEQTVGEATDEEMVTAAREHIDEHGPERLATEIDAGPSVEDIAAEAQRRFVEEENHKQAIRELQNRIAEGKKVD